MRLLRGDGPLIRVGHRGAAALAPENTLRSFEVALAHGVNAIEFDVLDLTGGPLVLAHSNDLAEVSHGAAVGTVRDRSLAELQELAPQLPTLDDALDFLAEREVALHVDLKLTTRLDELVESLERHGLVERAVVSSFNRESLRAVAAHGPAIKIGFTTRKTATASRGAERFSRRSASVRLPCAGRSSRGAGDDRARRRRGADAPSRSRVGSKRRARARSWSRRLGLDGRRSGGARAPRRGGGRRRHHE